MTRRLVLLLAALLMLAPLAATQADGASTKRQPFFSTSVSSGDTIAALSIGTNLMLKNVTVSSVTVTTTGSTISASGSLYVGNETHPLAVSLRYTNRTTLATTSGSWTITVSKGSAGDTYTPLPGSGVSLNNVSGTISGSLNGGFASIVTNCSLTITGVTYRGATFNGTAALSPAGVTATVVVGDITLPGGTSGGSISVTASSTSGATSASVAFTGAGSSPLSASLAFTDTNNWSATITKGSTTATTLNGATVNFNNLSGTISKTNGALTTSLVLSGVTVGNATFDVDLNVSPAGVVGTATVGSLMLGATYEIDNATVSVSSASHTASLSGTLATGGTNVAITAEYTDATNWLLSIATNSAPSGYAPANATTLDINDLSGTITDANGAISTALSVSGVTVGSGTFDMSATITPSGVEASAVASDLVIGGLNLESAAITISTVQTYADITASLTTDAGTFDVDVQASALSGGGYHLQMAADGADLSAGGADFYLQSFGFSWSGDVPASGCTTVDAAVNGSVVMKNTTYTLNNAEIAFSCQTLTKFIFSVTVSHTATYDNQVKTVTLTINWLTGSGVYTPTFGPSNQFTGTTYSYYKGFFGTVDLSSTRGFSRSGMKRTVTLGLGFTVAVYQAWSSSGPWSTSIGAMGYFDADRVSGDIACTFNASPSTDFTCGGDIRINPSFAGIWHYDWTGI